MPQKAHRLNFIDQTAVSPVASDVGGGAQLNGVCAPVLAQRWAERWTRPLAAWRSQPGISDKLKQSQCVPQI
jgi:ubiquinone biosynthesis protein Coq4